MQHSPEEQLDLLDLLDQGPQEPDSFEGEDRHDEILAILDEEEGLALVSSPEGMLGRLYDRFHAEESVVNRESLLWEDIENALKADPHALLKLMQLENSGGEPQVFREVDGHFEFADCFRRPPELRKGLSYERAKELVDAWGTFLMDEKTYLDFLSRVHVDKFTSTLLLTPDEMLERKGHAKLGKRLYGRPIVTSIPAKNPGDRTAFRCVLRVKKI